MYTGSSKDHLATDGHKNFKALVKSLRELDHDDKNSLFKKYVSKKTNENTPSAVECNTPSPVKRVVKPVETALKTPLKKAAKNASHFTRL
jgi:hypothetical protein